MNIEILLKGVLDGAKRRKGKDGKLTKTARDRHLSEARKIQWLIHTERGKSLNPHDWQVSDLRWVLTEAQTPGKDWTRYRCWQATELIVRALGKTRDWEPHLRGPWIHAPQTLKKHRAYSGESDQ